MCPLAAVVMVGISCREQGDTQARMPGGTDEAARAAYTLAVVDSVGVELGDSNYVFGAIAETDIGPDGSIYVLDNMKCTLFRYTSGGEFIHRTGRRGSGPGELLEPYSFSVMDDGSISIWDGQLGWARYDSLGECVSSRTRLDPWPMRFISLDSVCILGMLNGLSREGSNLIAEKLICRWNADHPDSVETEYLARDYSIEISGSQLNWNDLVEIDFFPMLFCAGDEFVCVAPDPRRLPMLVLFHEDGSVTDTLMLPYTEVLRTEEELLARKQHVEELFSAMSGHARSVNWEPFPAKPMITCLGVDSLNRIWIQRGFEQNPTFDLYNTSGELLATAVLPGRNHTENWKFNVTGNGILAVPENPESYYKVYTIRCNE